MKRCVVTGAAAGIGRALAERFAASGFEVVGVDEKEAPETRAGVESAGGRFNFHRADLASRADVERVVLALASSGPVDVLIHNAGINLTGRFEHSDIARQRHLAAVNLRAPLLLTAGLLREDAVARGGSVVFVSSLSRFVGYPGAAVYAATKDGLASYARSLAVALAPKDVHVLTVYPGPTRTEHARQHSPDNTREHKRMAPSELAGRVFRAVQRRRRVLLPGAGAHAFAVLGHFLPRVTEKAMQKTLLDKLEAAAPGAGGVKQARAGDVPRAAGGNTSPTARSSAKERETR